MKKLLLALTTIFMTFASNATTFDLFYSPTCPHCHHAMEFIDSTLKAEYPDVKFVYHNVAKPVEANLMKHYASKLNISDLGVPLAIVGSEFQQGFGAPTGQIYRDILNKYAKAEPQQPISEQKDLSVKEESKNIEQQLQSENPQKSFFTTFNIVVLCAVLILGLLLIRKYKK